MTGSGGLFGTLRPSFVIGSRSCLSSFSSSVAFSFSTRSLGLFGDETGGAEEAVVGVVIVVAIEDATFSICLERLVFAGVSLSLVTVVAAGALDSELDSADNT